MLTDIQILMFDTDGQKASHTVHMAAGTDPTALSALQGVLDGISSAGISGIVASYHDDTPGIAGSESGPYDSAGDKLVLEFTGSQGSPVKFSIPAPDEDCFTADGETPDMAFLQADIDVLAANAKDSAGGAITFARAYRTKTRRKQQ